MASKLLEFLLPLPREFHTHPGARTLRTSLGKKFKDIFFAFAGKLNPAALPNKLGPWLGSKEPRAGLFDYLTLFIPRLVTGLAIKIFDLEDTLNTLTITVVGNAPATVISSKSIYTYIAFGLAWLINIPALIARYLVAAATTLVVALPVIAIHLVSSLIELVTRTYETALTIQNKNDEYLGHYLASNNMAVDDLRLTSIKAENNDSERTITLALTAKKEKVRSEEEQSPIESPSPEPFIVEIKQNKVNGIFYTCKENQENQIHALLALNLFKADSRLRDMDNPKLTRNCDSEVVTTVLLM